MQQRGFTLIELIIVIVILGILAVTAAPRFIDLQSDATASTIQGVKAALQGGSQLVYAKSAIEGEQADDASDTPTPEAQFNGADIPTHFGYPEADGVSATLNAWLDIDTTNEFDIIVSGDGVTGVSTGSFAVLLDQPAAVTDIADVNCHVLYTEAASQNASPTIVAVTGGC